MRNKISKRIMKESKSKYIRITDAKLKLFHTVELTGELQPIIAGMGKNKEGKKRRFMWAKILSTNDNPSYTLGTNCLLNICMFDDNINQSHPHITIEYLTFDQMVACVL